MSDIKHYIAPTTLEQALETLALGRVTILSGGTDLTPQVSVGRRHFEDTLMNIRRIEGLSQISMQGDEIRIGGSATVSDIRYHDLIMKYAPLLCETASHFASEQIRNAASIGGNICNASPAGDMIIPLLVLGASVELASWTKGVVQTRRIPLDEFFTGPGKTLRNSNELLAAVIFKKPSADFVGFFRKSGPRPALEISTVSLGIGGEMKEGKFQHVRVAMGAVGPTPLRGRQTEAALEGQKLTRTIIDHAVLAAQQDASPIDDIRATKWYRNHLVAVFTEELLYNVCQN
ncbi:MAG: xanthine dehydrogenase family protein subunit M [Emcibacter sp.]|nr:xanthine dehydrogenase family protein subunit M [Emcibacter sp.]